MRFFILIFIKSISALTRMSHKLDKSFPKKMFCKGGTALFWNIALVVYTQSIWSKFLSICNSLLSADIDLQKCAWKSAYFFTEKQTRKKKRTKTGEKRILCKFVLINIGFSKKYICSKIGGELFSISSLPITFLKLPSISPLIISFCIKYRRSRLLLESFIELLIYDFMIYQLVNKRTEILPIAISQIAHLCN